jgi:hypothetical protein
MVEGEKPELEGKQDDTGALDISLRGIMLDIM